MKTCPYCAESIQDAAVVCRYCRSDLSAPRRPTSAIAEDTSAMRMLMPVGRSGRAIASGYFGLISVLLFPAPLALITGLMAVRDIRKNSSLHGMGRAIFGIIMGALGTLAILGLIVMALMGKH